MDGVDPTRDRSENGVSGNVRTGEWGINLTQKMFDSRAAGRVALGLVSVFAVTTVTLLPAEARHFRAKVATHPHEQHESPSYAAIVVDGNSGNVLHSASADELRHPASLTKIMTLYLLFERLESGKLKLDSQLPVSEHASVQAPTKLGLKPGQTIAVEDAIKGLVTKSANDAAVVVAEAIGGTEGDFAEMMTKKAHALGMSRTVYHNASGLPNDEQVTTARDQALLGRAIQERFPRQYRYFSTQSFTYHGETMGNHNHLLGHVEGVDGIKTGYTQASGFNLVTSVHRNNHFIVAVVLGGASAGARDAKMRNLIEEHIATGSTQHTVAAIVEGAAPKVATRASEPKAEAHPTKTASTPAPGWPASKFVAAAPADNSPTATASAKAVAQAADDDVIKPIPVKTIKVKLTQSQTAGLGPIIAPVEAITEPMVAAATPPKAAAPAPKAIAAAPAPVATTPVALAPAAPVPAAPPPVAPVVVAAAPAPAAPAVVQAVAAVAPPKAPAPAAKTGSMMLASVTSTPVTAAPVAAAPVAPAPVAEAAPTVAPAPKAAITAPKLAGRIVAGLTQNDVAPVAPPPAGPVVSAPVAPAPVASAPVADPAPAAPPKAPAATPKATASAPASATLPTPPQIAPAAWKPTPAAAAEASAPEAKRDAPVRSAQTHGGWVIQIGAFDAEHDAQQKLSAAQAKIGHVLDRADPFTEVVMKGDKTLYRARFAGFPQKDDADAVCKQLKRNDIECMTIKN
jgi:D-alanyl-D-alanine carboxypeptidase